MKKSMKMKLKRKILGVQAGLMASVLIGVNEAHAQYYRDYLLVNQHSNNFSDISRNIMRSIEELPSLLTGISYLIGLGMGILGIMKVKDHVDNPQQSPLKDGAVRLAGGGALFALPIVYEAMQTSIGLTSIVMHPAEIGRIQFNVR